MFKFTVTTDMFGFISPFFILSFTFVPIKIKVVKIIHNTNKGRECVLFVCISLLPHVALDFAK